jgi:hypothetical protein
MDAVYDLVRVMLAVYDFVRVIDAVKDTVVSGCTSPALGLYVPV